MSGRGHRGRWRVGLSRKWLNRQIVKSLNNQPPVALTIAGSDSSAGAGVQADLKTFSALGVYGLNAITCVVAETPGKVARIQDIGAQIVQEQLDVLFASFPIAAIKTGLLHSADVVATTARELRNRQQRSGVKLPVVIDPVMVATSGDQLLRDDAVETYERELFPLATLITPNLDEAARLLGEPIRSLEEMRSAGKELTAKYGVPILLKGGHLPGEKAIDLLLVESRIVEFSAPFSPGVATHGTGCTYSAAITAGLAVGLSLEDSIRRAKQFVTDTIVHHFGWRSDSGAIVHALNHEFPRLK